MENKTIRELELELIIFNSTLGQFIELKEGRLDELVIKNDEFGDLLRAMIANRIKETKVAISFQQEQPH